MYANEVVSGSASKLGAMGVLHKPCIHVAVLESAMQQQHSGGEKGPHGGEDEEGAARDVPPV